MADTRSRRPSAIWALILIAVISFCAYVVASDRVAKRLNEPGWSRDHLFNIGDAIIKYADTRGRFPPMYDAMVLKSALGTLSPNQAWEVGLFEQPVAGQPYGTNSALSGMSIQSAVRIGKALAVYETSPAPDGSRLVLFIVANPDSNDNWLAIPKVEKVSGQEWQRISMARSRVPSSTRSSDDQPPKPATTSARGRRAKAATKGTD